MSGSNVVPITRAPSTAQDYQSQRVDPAPWQVDSSFVHNASVFFSTPGSRMRHKVLAPPYRYEDLASIVQRTPSLRRAIPVMAQRVGGYGYDLVPRFPELDGAEELELDQRAELELFLAGSGYDCGGWLEMRRRKGLNFYLFGNGALRIVRDRLGRIAASEHIPIASLRIIAPEESDPEQIIRVPLFLPSSGKVLWVDRPTRFRRYQAYDSGRTRFYKALGDPRPLNARTGEYRPQGAADYGLEEAQELLWFADYWPGSDHYGQPSWIATRDPATAEANLGALLRRWTADGLLDVKLLLTSNGSWDPEFRKELERHLTEHLRGWANAFQVLLGSAMAGVDAAAGAEARLIDGEEVKAHTNTIVPVDLSSKLDLGKIVDNLVNLASFNRSYAFGLPPSLLGIVEEDSRATAEATKAAAEEGIFIPARQADDDNLSLYLWPEMGITHWMMRSRHARTGEEAAALASSTPIVAGGALTINQMVEWANKITGFDWPLYEDEWAKVPIALAAGVATGQKTPEEANADEDGAVKSARVFREFARRVVALRDTLVDAETGREIIEDVKREAQRAGQTLPGDV